jgi:RNA polymerase sigma factor (sigma-70 family)
VALVVDPRLGHAGPAVVLPIPASEDFADLFRDQYPRLIRALRLAGADQWQAEDIAQETFARTLGHWRRVRAGANPPGYLYRTAFRLLRRRGLVPPVDWDDRIDVHAVSPADAAVLGVDLERALAVMPPRRRACVILCWLLETPTAEAASALGIADGTVRKHLEFARRGLTDRFVP